MDQPPQASGSPTYAWVDTDQPRASRFGGRRLWGAAAAVALVLGGLAAWDLTRTTAWPSGCDVAGNASWCTDPSDAITAPALVELVRGHCPELTRVAAGDVVPQPLTELGLAGEGALAKTSGRPTAGSEEVLLGAGGSARAWVTRWQDGSVEIRCPGSSATTPSLRLQADQLGSTVAAGDGGAARLDFTAVAKDLAASIGAERPSDISYGFLSCDTAGIDLAAPAEGATFSCSLEVYGLQGQGAYREAYRVTGERPYYEPV